MATNKSGQLKTYYECDTLYISNIPNHLNNVSKIIRHFKEFGSITSVWCSGTVANIVFSSVEEAKAAYKSPKAYMNNRFVIFKYHNHPSESNSRLSRFVNKDRVMKGYESTKKNIENHQKEQEQIILCIKEKNKKEKEIAELIKQLDEKYNHYNSSMGIANQLAPFIQTNADYLKMHTDATENAALFYKEYIALNENVEKLKKEISSLKIED